ncbi:MAG: hypothetical protein A2Y60_03455 [Chloroflexi bacterium RBG_13_54_9]|nr:MAG: hypothetical protein A2Y60_03455 [Chloroflexi bacterium RBG_13_54_9]
MLVIVGLLVMLALFLACKAPEVTRTSEEGGGVGTPLVLPTATPLGAEVKPISGGWLRQSFSADPPYWDPNMGVSDVHVTLNRVHTTLVQYKYGPKYPEWNFDIDTANSLAQSWEISKDGLTYTFHLRQRVQWQNKPPMNGREFVATDVKWTLERHIATPGAPRREQLSVIESIECPDKYTVVLHLKEPRGDLLLLLGSAYVEILAPELVTVTGDLNTPKALVGLGPLMLDDYTPGVRLVFKKNPTYYRAKEGLPYLDGQYWVVIPDPSTSLAAFRAEKIDIRGISRLELASVKKTNPNIYCYENELGALVGALSFRTDKAPFNDVRLRRAVSMALDRKLVIDTFYFGYGVEQRGPIHAAAPWYLKDQGECAKYYQYNLEEAKRLVAEAGYPGGLSVSLALNTAWGSTYREYCEFCADALSKIGIKVTLKPMENAAYFASVYNAHAYDDLTFIYVWAGATLGPDCWVEMYQKGRMNNWSNAADPKLDELAKAQMVEMDPAKRQELLNEMQRYEACQMNYVHWPVGYGVTCLQPWVRDYKSHAASWNAGRIAELIWLTEDAPGRKGPSI